MFDRLGIVLALVWLIEGDISLAGSQGVAAMAQGLFSAADSRHFSR
jgi:hypothetical protein